MLVCSSRSFEYEKQNWHQNCDFCIEMRVALNWWCQPILWYQIGLNIFDLLFKFTGGLVTTPTLVKLYPNLREWDLYLAGLVH